MESHNLNVRLGVRRGDELFYITTFDDHQGCQLYQRVYKTCPTIVTY
jgi:hypothetical protein